jgi:hypothetical protein
MFCARAGAAGSASTQAASSSAAVVAQARWNAITHRNAITRWNAIGRAPSFFPSSRSIQIIPRTLQDICVKLTPHLLAAL